MPKNLLYNAILASLLTLEFLFIFVFFDCHITSQTFNAIGLLLSSLLFGTVLIVKFYNTTTQIDIVASPARKKYIMYLLYALCLVYLNTVTIDMIKYVDFKSVSDILPIITVLSKRFLAGLYPYSNDALVALYYNGPSGYLPMHWLPCTIPEYFHFDYRTMTFLMWCSGALVIMVRSLKCREVYVHILTPLLLTIAYSCIAYADPNIWGATVENMVAGYYLLLIFGLNQRNSILTGILIGCCLLSRYYVAMWLPLWFFVLFVSGERKQLLLACGSLLIFVCLLYIIPFLSKDWTSFYRAYLLNYGDGPIGEWRQLNTHHLPSQLFRGAGMAHLFYLNYLHKDLHAGFMALKKTFFILNLSILSLMGAWYWLYKKKINQRIFLIASFKIYLSIFLAFIVVPYIYLEVTAIFVSIAIFAEQARYRIEG